MVMVSCERFSCDSAASRWGQIVHGLFGSADTLIGHPRQFRGEIRQSSFGNLHLSAIVSSTERVKRTKCHIAEDIRKQHVLVAVRTGSVTVRQRQRDCRVTAGNFVLFDTDAPMEWFHEDATEMFNVTLPAHLLESRVRNVTNHFVRPISSATAPWRITWNFLDTVSAQIPHIDEIAAYRYAQSLVDFLGLAIESENGSDTIGTSSGARLAVYKRCTAYIRANISDHSLNPNKIADAMKISVRYLHRVFQDAEDSVCDFIKSTRLEACHAELADPPMRHQSIASIAHRNGFRSQSYFATAFREKYEMSAREWRRDAALADHAKRAPSFDMQTNGPRTM